MKDRIFKHYATPVCGVIIIIASTIALLLGKIDATVFSVAAGVGITLFFTKDV